MLSRRRRGLRGLGAEAPAPAAQDAGFDWGGLLTKVVSTATDLATSQEAVRAAVPEYERRPVRLEGMERIEEMRAEALTFAGKSAAHRGRKIDDGLYNSLMGEVKWVWDSFMGGAEGYYAGGTYGT